MSQPFDAAAASAAYRNALDVIAAVEPTIADAIRGRASAHTSGGLPGQESNLRRTRIQSAVAPASRATREGRPASLGRTRAALAA